MTHPALSTFVAGMDALVAGSDDPHVVAKGTSEQLAELLPQPQFLEDRFRQPGEDCYRQHVVHVHPQGRYSLVALVWAPGQATPIHDHRCWCVVGVLEGREREERYSLQEQDGEESLTLAGHGYYDPGQVCQLVPPDENIHRVINASDEQTISLHVYGADIADCGTSINRVFDLPVRDPVRGTASAVSWRDRDDDPAAG